ncbi:uncharacterized protein [Temnothorax longispinosus]|uniref:uncharacterized protein isoform X1 n=1 Tax=Temnothorax longispinosus TaxID=300112 RepID=UPI003A996FB5
MPWRYNCYSSSLQQEGDGNEKTAINSSIASQSKVENDNGPYEEDEDIILGQKFQSPVITPPPERQSAEIDVGINSPIQNQDRRSPIQDQDQDRRLPIQDQNRRSPIQDQDRRSPIQDQDRRSRDYLPRDRRSRDLVLRTGDREITGLATVAHEIIVLRTGDREITGLATVDHEIIILRTVDREITGLATVGLEIIVLRTVDREITSLATVDHKIIVFFMTVDTYYFFFYDDVDWCTKANVFKSLIYIYIYIYAYKKLILSSF